jgi:microcystin-dependent protein
VENNYPTFAEKKETSMKMIRILVAALLMTTVLAVNVSLAAMPATLSYQGSLYGTDGTPVDGVKKLTFRLYTVSTGGAALWTEVQNSVNITKGHYSTVLGATTALSIGNFTADTWLGIAVESDAEMSPREQLTSVPFAFNGVPQHGIIMWHGSPSAVPAGWALCDGNNGTPDLRGRFIVGASKIPDNTIIDGTDPALSQYGWKYMSGEEKHTLTISEMPSHDHAHGDYRMLRYNGEGTDSSSGDNSSGEPNIHHAGASPLANGGGLPHENRPPYYALAYIMKL